MSVSNADPGIVLRKPAFFFGAVISFFLLMIAGRIMLPQILIMAGLFLCAMAYFVLGRLPRAEHALYALAAYLPFGKQLSEDAGNFPPLVWVVSVILALALLGFYFDKTRPRSALAGITPVHIPLFVFLALGIVSVLHGVILKGVPLAFGAGEFFEKWLLPFLIFQAVFLFIRSREAAENMTVIMVAATAAVSLLAVFEFLSRGEVSSIERARVGGIANDPNILAAFLNYCLFIPLAFLLKDRGKFKKVLWLLVFALAVRALLGTFSRGGYLAFGIGIYAGAFMIRKRLLIPVLIVTSLAALHPDFLPSSMRERIAQTFEPAADPSAEGVANLDKSNRDRIEIWKGSVQIIKEHPVFGIGYTLFKTTIKDYWPGRVPFEPHNTYLFIAAEMGIPALLIYLWLMGALGRETFRLYQKTRDRFPKALALGFWAGAVSLWVSQMFVIRLDALEISGYFWILTGLVVSLNRTEEVKPAAGFTDES